MPRKPIKNNYDRVHNMSPEELADFIGKIVRSESAHKIDWYEYLEKDDPRLLPPGKHVEAEILTTLPTRQVVDVDTVEAIIVDDNQLFFGERYVKFYDMDKDQFYSVPYWTFTVKRWYDE